MSVAPNTSVDQVFDALRLLAGGDVVGVADAAREMDLPTSTAHRILATVADTGFARRDTTGTKYELGVQAHMLVHGLFRQFRIQREALPFLSHLAKELGETTTLDVRIGWLAVRMAGFEGWNDIHAGRRIGQTTPLAETAGGLAILAFDDDPADYRKWAKAGRRPAGSFKNLGDELVRIRRRGYARRPEPDSNGAEIALPIRASGRAVAAICINGQGPLLAERPDSDALATARAVTAELESRVAEEPEIARDPFAHLDADELTTAAGG